MRKLVFTMSMSLDGFMEGPNHELDWQLVDDEVHDDINAYLRTTSAFVYGRVTYELMAEFWPTADQDPESSRPMREFARIWRAMPRVVYSRSLRTADSNTTIVREVVPEEVRALKAQHGGDVAVGGARLAASLMRHGLVDECRVYVHPVLIGAGRPLFEPSDRRTGLTLMQSRAFANGVQLLRYAVSAREHES